jgi:hypothetical protein
MPSGVCVGWMEEKGFGFIRPDAGGARPGDAGTDERRGKPRANRVRVI